MKHFCFLFILIFAFLSGAACTHSVHLVHAGDFDHSRSGASPVAASSEQYAVMGLVFDTNYVERAYENLADQCRNGEIFGIMARYSTSHGFLSWTHKLHLEGYCSRSN